MLCMACALSRVQQKGCQRLGGSPAMGTFPTLQNLPTCIGQGVATSDRNTPAQEQVSLFAQATGEHP